HSKHFRTLTNVNQEDMDKEVGTSTGAMIKSAVFSQIIILIVYLPILSLEGIEGKMFKPMAYTVAFAILGAFILSITYVPMMAALVLNKKLKHTPTFTERLMQFVERRYQPLLNKVLSFPKAVIASTVTLFVFAIFLLLNMGGEFIPQLEEGDFAVETRVLTGSNLNNTIDATQKASKLLVENFPEVQKVVTKIGSAEIPTDPMPFEAGDMMVILKDKKEWVSAKTFPELSMKMTKVLEQVPGISVGFQFPVQMRFNELMTGARQDVVCKIFGENLDTLTKYAGKLNSIIQTIDGAVNVYEEKVTGMPQVVIKYNRDGMAKYGLNVADINKVVNSAFAGQVAGQVYEEEKRFDMVVRLDGEARKNMTDIENLSITTPKGIAIPLSAVANIEQIEGVNQIQRENTKRRIIVGFNVNGKDIQSIVKTLQSKINQQLNLQKGYAIVYGGSFENMTAAKARLSIVVPIALCLIFLLLYFAFGSVKQGLLIYTAIPLSAMGGIFALSMRSMPFSISAGVGFIALFGVAVLNGILLVSEFNRLKAEGWQDVKRIVIHSTKSKLRAVLMTAFVPALGFIPMAISTGAGGEVQKPLATVVIGGLIISTLLTLFVLPVMYILFDKGFAYFNKTKTTVLLLALMLFGANMVHAQEKITLAAAIDSAIKNNASGKIGLVQIKYQEALKKSNFDIEKTAIGFGYGKINGFNNDNLYSISQNIQFPTVYKYQGAINQSNIDLSVLTNLQKMVELKMNVKKHFYQLLLLTQKRKLLNAADSIYSEFALKTDQHFSAGNADVLQKITAENQLTQIQHQLQALNTTYQSMLNQFNLLINCKAFYAPAAEQLILTIANIPELSSLSQTPLLKLQDANIVKAEHQLKLEQSKMMPSLNAGFNSATIVGWQTTTQNNERYFGTNDRFNSVSAGLALPIFSSAQRSKIKASRIAVEQNKIEKLAFSQQVEANFKDAIALYVQNTSILASYQNKSLPNAKLLIEAATKKLNSGEISYIEWVMLINQSIQVQNEYLGYVQQLNEAAIEIEKMSAIN
ncbi:MAG: hypothetical protein RLZ56_179, partial [Bacteroidota bacterium]